MPPISRLRLKRTALHLSIVGVALIAMACEAINACNPSSKVTLTPTPTETAVVKATTAATSAATAAATSAASGTAAAAATTAAAGTAFTGTAKLGVDHPPFLTSYPGGGKSYVLFCGSITGANGGSISVGLSGTTGQPANATGTIGADGKYSIAVPIQQFGSITASSVTVKNATGTQLIGTIAPVSLTVGADDVACTP